MAPDRRSLRWVSVRVDLGHTPVAYSVRAEVCLGPDAVVSWIVGEPDAELLIQRHLGRFGFGPADRGTQVTDGGDQPSDLRLGQPRLRRLGVVRQFARHLHTLDPATEVPPAGLLRCFPNRMPPHLYSADEIDALLHAEVLFRQPLRVATYRALIGLPGRVLVVGVLGPLSVSVDGRPMEVSAPKLRTLLVVLAMEAGSAVSLDQVPRLREVDYGASVAGAVVGAVVDGVGPLWSSGGGVVVV
jgi:hypothetical protein